MKEYTLPRKTLLLWQIRISLLAIVFVCVCMYLDISFYICAAVIAGLGAVILLILPLFFRSIKIKVVNDSVIVKRGIFVTTTHIFPFSRLIYINRYTSLIAKRMGLSGIVLKGVSSSLFLPELEEKAIETLIAEITGNKNDEK